MNQQLAQAQLIPVEIYALAYRICREIGDARPVLGCVRIDEGRLVATDGCRMHIFHHAPTWAEWAAVHYAGDAAPPEPPAPDLWPCARRDPPYHFHNLYPDYTGIVERPVRAVIDLPLAHVLADLHKSRATQDNYPYIDIRLSADVDKREFGRWITDGNLIRLSSDYVADALTNHHRYSDIVRFETMGEPYAVGPVRIETFGMTVYIMPMRPPAL